MAKRITFSELVARVQSGAITEPEAEDYFAFDSTRSKPGAPGFAIREINVDVTGVERLARESAYELAIKAARVAGDNRIKTLASAPKPDGSIIAEGDSWFQLPSWYQKTMIYWLQQEYPITNIAHPGDELAKIMAAGEHLPYLATGKVKVLMFSAGGNDFLGGNLSECLNLFDPDHTDPSQAGYYLNKEFDEIIRDCDSYYRLLSQKVASISPGTQIIVHGYDHANPWPNGIFMGKHMEYQGLDPAWNEDLCNAIIHLMIDRFNDVLKNLAGFLPNFTYVDFRGTLKAGNGSSKPGDFFDELHAKSEKAKLLAKIMAKHLDRHTARTVSRKSGERAAA